jgi:hypothetical protein
VIAMIGRLVAATTLVAAAGTVAVEAPAAAATCSSASGVSVVVDFHELGGGAPTDCVAGGGGKTAASLFKTAGFPLTYVQGQAFVCRVSGKPTQADEPCNRTPPADAYWGLWWSDGKSGSWTYSSLGVASLKIPDGGYVAFSWNGSSTRSAPGVSPTPHARPTPTPTPTHSSAPSGGASGPTHSSAPATAPPAPATSAPSSAAAPRTAATAPTAQPSASGKPEAHRKPGGPASTKAKPSPTASAAPESPTTAASTAASAEASDDAVAVSSDPADPGDGGLPAWVAPAVIVVLFGAAGTVAVVRRRGAGGP